MSKHIIDRRENPKGKSTGNRQKFLRRANKYLKEKLKEKILERSISDTSSEDITIPIGDLDEPEFRHDPNTGKSERVLPGNDRYVVGDEIPKPPSGGGGGGGGDASDDGEGEDSFEFTLSRDEYLNVIFEDLELPRMTKKTDKDSTVTASQRAGFVNDGNPAQLDLVHSMRNSLGRRIALGRRQRNEDLDELIAELATCKVMKRRKELEDLILKAKAKLKAVPYIDPVDLRYRNYTQVPVPRSSAVMICVMDVSASMGEREKDLAKRFYTLLYLFLERKYQKVEVVFIRHHTKAEEVDEDTFFNSKETGGTVVSTGLDLAMQILSERYPHERWNSYIAQCTDGDNFGHDTDTVRDMLDNVLLPYLNHFFYIEIENTWQMNSYQKTDSDLWSTYSVLADRHDNLTVADVHGEYDIVPVFRKIFAKEEK